MPQRQLAAWSSSTLYPTILNSRRYTQSRTMSAAPVFWSTPLRYCRWAARERPALFWSVIVGAAGPALMPIVPPIRHYFGDVDPAPVPVTYPVPNGPRKQLTGYDD
ncbi:hypothetical protein VFPBJ_11000 [Purpureocillium lilacinum]|uniref:NADH-ubiquinone oxidoreductase 9.5 kDa subunit n=1 Tax=Purpureocillium lilacinum TaxID=33203 RepID=A0A179FP13_PURLI|nr:hypothetical protein VFPBJ_11000 [Purpureocillium lilacinum]